MTKRLPKFLLFELVSEVTSLSAVSAESIHSGVRWMTASQVADAVRFPDASRASP